MPEGKPLPDVIKTDHDFPALNRVPLVNRPIVCHRFPVHRAQRHPGRSCPIAGLVEGMNPASQVAARGHEGSRVIHDPNVGFAVCSIVGNQSGKRGELLGPTGDGIRIIPGAAATARLLHVDKGEIPAPVLAPPPNQRPHQGILIDPFNVRTAFALVPEDAPDRIRNKRANLDLIEHADSGGTFTRFGHRGPARRISLKSRLAHPRARGRTAQAARDEADRRLDLIPQCQPETEVKRGKFHEIFRGCFLPCFSIAGEQPDLRVRSGGNTSGQYRIVFHIKVAPLRHVGLAGTQPDFAHQHVREDHGFRGPVGSYGQAARFSGSRHRVEFDLPLALCVRRRLFCLAGKFHPYLFVRRGAPPYGNGRVTLQHHVITQHRRQLDCREDAAVDSKQQDGH